MNVEALNGVERNAILCLCASQESPFLSHLHVGHCIPTPIDTSVDIDNSVHAFIYMHEHHKDNTFIKKEQSKLPLTHPK